MVEYQFVEVTWEDAQHGTYAVSPDDLEEFELVQTKSAGYIIHKDKVKVVLGFMLFDADNKDDALIKHWQVIPMGMVRKIETIKKAVH